MAEVTSECRQETAAVVLRTRSTTGRSATYLVSVRLADGRQLEVTRFDDNGLYAELRPGRTVSAELWHGGVVLLRDGNFAIATRDIPDRQASEAFVLGVGSLELGLLLVGAVSEPHAGNRHFVEHAPEVIDDSGRLGRLGRADRAADAYVRAAYQGRGGRGGQVGCLVRPWMAFGAARAARITSMLPKAGSKWARISRPQMWHTPFVRCRPRRDAVMIRRDGGLGNSEALAAIAGHCCCLSRAKPRISAS